MNVAQYLSAACSLMVSLACAQDSQQHEQATESPPSTVLEPVVVTGSRDPARASYARLLEGVAVFNARHGLAPNGTLLFEALDQLATAPPLVLSLETTDKAIALKTDSLGRFVLPTTDVAGSNVGEIVSNRPSGLLKIKPLVLSTGTSGSSRRLGDLRLQCEVLWAIEKHDVSLFLRGAFGVVGGPCSSSKLSAGFAAPQKLAAVELVFGERRATVQLAISGLTYWPPLYDESWPDDALVVLKSAAKLSGGTPPTEAPIGQPEPRS